MGGDGRCGAPSCLCWSLPWLSSGWRRREGYLTQEACSSMGGVTGSLTQWADQACQSLAQEGPGSAVSLTARLILKSLSLASEVLSLLIDNQ